jgi:FkbH-like protein
MEPAAARHAARVAVARWRAIAEGRHPERAAGRTLLIAASFTANPIGPSLGVALDEGEPGRNPATIRFADYNQIFQICLQPDAHGAGDTGADEVVLLWRIEDVFERDFHSWANGEEGARERLLDGVRSLAAAAAHLAASRASPVIVADAPVPVGFGLDHTDPSALAELIALQHDVNEVFDEALERAGSAGIERLRLAALQHAHGTLASFDRRNWVMYRQPYADWFAGIIGHSIAESIVARTKVPPKVLVLDCDDTLWSGVLADDGVGGLDCSDTFPGFAFRSFQIAAQRLRHRGVLLAIASKNDDARVVEAFATVDGMVLTGDDIAARRVAWSPKPEAIAEIANELNLGLDAVVFVDDSDYELGAVATQLPGVRTLRVPDDIEALPDLLAESGLWRMTRVTDDDRHRTERIRAEAGRSTAATSMSHDDFISSLALRVHVIDVGSDHIGRVTQLVNKTNQFNLTTVRRTEAEIAALVADPDACVLAFAADDRFGEYGIVGVTITCRTPEGWQLDTALMSCRVLGRGVETAMLAATVARARSLAPGAVVGHYRATDRNAMVAELLPEHGFTELPAAGEPGRRSFSLAAGQAIDVPAHLGLVGL